MTLQELDVLGTWVAGLGTLLAVIVSLYLARTLGCIKLKVIAGERQIITSGSTETPDVVTVLVTNCSQRPAKVTHVSWQIGFRKKKHFIQMFNVPGYETLPKMLNEGEEGHFVIPYKIHGNDEDWDKSTAQYLLENSFLPQLYISTLRCVVSTSVGQQFKVKVEKNLRNRLLHNYKANKSNQQGAQKARASA
jgi:hypothetical protein